MSKAVNVMSDMYVVTAIENVARYLPRAVADWQRPRGPHPCSVGQYPVGFGDVRGALARANIRSNMRCRPSTRSCRTAPA